VAKGVTIIIPIYNGEKYIREAVESVTGQASALRVSFILADDGSTDRSELRAREALTGSEYLYLRQENRGTASARNLALQHATTEYILFLDADDRMRKGALETLRLPFEEDPSLEIVAGKAMDFLSEDLSPTERAQRSGALRREPYGGVLPGAQLIRRTVFEKTGPFDASLRTGETVEWQIRARDADVRQKQVDVVVLERRIHDANKGLLMPTRQREEYANIIRSRLARRR
jgi:glycosyltransferase involved in cell wall biosynthesis